MNDQLLCLWGALLPPYIKDQGREAAGLGGGRAKGGVLLPGGVGLLLERPLPGRTSSPLLLYIQGQGAPQTQQLIIDLLAVCGAPLHHSPR